VLKTGIRIFGAVVALVAVIFFALSDMVAFRQNFGAVSAGFFHLFPDA
jgi:hypothetical protein